MKAAVLKSFGQPLSVEEVNTPEIGQDDVLVKVKACGVCHSDVKSWTGERKPKLPTILGHEVAGVVSELGKGVKTLAVGDPVVVYYYVTCGACDRCLSGMENFCRNMVLRQGGYAEYVSIPAKNCIKIPQRISFEDAAFITDAGLTSYHAIVDRAKAKLGQTALLIGVGGLGSSALQILKLIGAKVIVADVVPSKLEFAASLGADVTVNSTNQDVVAEVLKATNNEGVDCAFDYVGIPQTTATSIRSLRNGGTLVAVAGMTSLPEPSALSAGRFIWGWQIVTTRGGTRSNLRDLVNLLAEGKLKTIVTQSFDLQGATQALDLLHKGQILGRATVKP